jgi:hypothetical protein
VPQWHPRAVFASGMAKGNGQKTAKKTAKRTVESAALKLVPQPNGKGALLSGGVPGNKGGSGRPRKAFKKFCRELAASEKYQKALEDAATDDKHDQFIGAAKLVATFATSKPAKKVDHTHRHFSNPRDVLADRLARIVDRN